MLLRTCPVWFAYLVLQVHENRIISVHLNDHILSLNNSLVHRLLKPSLDDGHIASWRSNLILLAGHTNRIHAVRDLSSRAFLYSNVGNQHTSVLDRPSTSRIRSEFCMVPSRYVTRLDDSREAASCKSSGKRWGIAPSLRRC
ncbi:hypothetical protein QVD17_28539 [Tagetes erecta]|uniref:Uncharacterized protein n=1 Tax=Tagetes erecta TaxID=13708 RepID=A0AAD8NSI8_TARER|nr:hypothetical protein QVD17_28539 [Tagetes erecta]